MATRKTKRYSDGGDVLASLMGRASSVAEDSGQGTNDREPMARSPMGNGDAEMMDQLRSRLNNAGNEGTPAMGIANAMGDVGSTKNGPPSVPASAREALQNAASAQAAKSALQGMQKQGGLEGMAGALRGAMASIPERGRNMGNRMGGMAKGGSVSSASSRGDGIAQRGKTRGKMC